MCLRVVQGSLAPVHDWLFLSHKISNTVQIRFIDAPILATANLRIMAIICITNTLFGTEVHRKSTLLINKPYLP